MIGTLLALICAALLLGPQDYLMGNFAYLTGNVGFEALKHSYQLLTYALLHANLAHYAYNMLWLVPSCWFLEEKVGRKPLALLVVFSSIASALLWQMCIELNAPMDILASLGAAPSPHGLIGASGVASATSAAALMVLSELEDRYSVVCYLMLAGIFICQLMDALSAQMTGSNVAYWGHVGGMLVAFFFAPALCRIALQNQPRRNLHY